MPEFRGRGWAGTTCSEKSDQNDCRLRQDEGRTHQGCRQGQAPKEPEDEVVARSLRAAEQALAAGMDVTNGRSSAASLDDLEQVSMDVAKSQMGFF